jgi:hypothetical protein
MKLQNSRNHDFSYFLCLLLEGSGSGRPKNIRTWIRIRIHFFPGNLAIQLRLQMKLVD